MRDVVTTLLDVLGLLLVAAGAAAAAAMWLHLGWASLVVAGAVVLAGSRHASRVARPERERRPLRVVALAAWDWFGLPRRRTA